MAASPAFSVSRGTVASLLQQFENRVASQQQGGWQGGTAAAAAAATADGGTPASVNQHQRKRARVGTWHSVLPVPSPNDGGAAAAGGVGGLSARQLYPWASGDFTEGAEAAVEGEASGTEVNEAAREARLEKIRAKFGTKVFLAPKEAPSAELRQQLGAAESDLSEDDYKLRRWEPMPVLLNQTSNAHVKNFVLKGMSGCVALASSLTHLFVLGAGQTIWIAEADGVKAERCGQEGVYLRFGEGNFLALKADEAATGAIMDAVNERATKRAALRRRRGSTAEAAAAAAAETGPGS